MRFFILSIIGLAALYKIISQGNHHYYIKTSQRVLKKLRVIEHPGQKFSYLRKISPYVFEEILLSALREKGYKIKRNKRYSSDGGLDGKVFYNGKWCLIQAKRYSSYINKAHVQSFMSLCDMHNVSGYFIHTGKTPQGVLSNIVTRNNNQIDIISGNDLLILLSCE